MSEDKHDPLYVAQQACVRQMKKIDDLTKETFDLKNKVKVYSDYCDEWKLKCAELKQERNSFEGSFNAINDSFKKLQEDVDYLKESRSKWAKQSSDNADLAERQSVVGVEKFIPAWEEQADLERFYLSALPTIRKIARECGYAIGVHGSLKRDFDLIAVPWTDEAVEADVLIKKIHEATCPYPNLETDKWKEKPHGRKARTLILNMNGMIDISVVPFKPPADSVAVEALTKIANNVPRTISLRQIAKDALSTLKAREGKNG